MRFRLSQPLLLAFCALSTAPHAVRAEITEASTAASTLSTAASAAVLHLNTNSNPQQHMALLSERVKVRLWIHSVVKLVTRPKSGHRCR